MNYVTLAICVVLGFVTTQVLIPILRRRTPAASLVNGARTFHHTHKTPISRFGGVALAAAFVLVSLVGFIWFPVDAARTRTRVVIVVSSLAMFLLGFWDDVRPLGARRKLLGQVLIATAVCFGGVQIETFQNPITHRLYELGGWGWLITVLWLVALTNMINLIDGIDGLAGGIALMMMALLTYVGIGEELQFPILVAATMCGALLGFLRYNFPPAKIYMGDGGAYFLGFLIGILTLVHSQKGTIVAALIAPLFALALPIVDVSLAILRRGFQGLPLFRPDRLHIHHRLQDLGMSRTRTVLVLYGISSIFLLMAFGVFWSQGRWVPILFGFMCLTLLLSARTFNFSRDWFAVGRVLENSAELRKETHYALALGRSLELGAERGGSLEDLWEDFVFLTRKLGFTGVRLTLEDSERLWQSPDLADAANLWLRSHDLGSERVMRVELAANQGDMSERLATHLSELAAEAWLKAANRWHLANGLALRFDARHTPEPVAPSPSG
jgi:UDP-GlcNAc:undecaprenyl-phosphate GlcNAc-1-phosphate transferase